MPSVIISSAHQPKKPYHPSQKQNNSCLKCWAVLCLFPTQCIKLSEAQHLSVLQCTLVYPSTSPNPTAPIRVSCATLFTIVSALPASSEQASCSGMMISFLPCSVDVTKLNIHLSCSISHHKQQQTTTVSTRSVTDLLQAAAECQQSRPLRPGSLVF